MSLDLEPCLCTELGHPEGECTNLVAEPGDELCDDCEMGEHDA